MEPKQIKKLYDRLSSRLRAQQRKCDNLDSWLRPELARGFDIPRKASMEHRALADLSRTPWLRLVVDNVTQAMYVDGIVGDGGPAESLWSIWRRNNLTSKQISNHRAFISYGHSYSVVTRGEGGARIRLLSPRRVAVEYDDLGDPYPSASLEMTSKDDAGQHFVLRVPGEEYRLVQGARTPTETVMDGLRVESIMPSGLSFVPVIRFANQLDLDGRVVGEVEPFIPSAQRINKTSYDRLLAQHFNSWKVKTATGLELPSEGEASEKDAYFGERGPLDLQAVEELKVKLAQDDILVSEDPETKFSTLDATALDPFVNSWRSDIEALAAVSQTPAHALTGQLVNLSPEALAAARSPLTQKVYERQMGAGEAYALTLRCAALIEGDVSAAQDDMVRCTWQDMEIRSMSQAVDALGKAATMLGIPKRALWGRIPGVESSDVQEWQRMADEDAESDPLNAVMRRHQEPQAVDADFDGEEPADGEAG